jgi:hypothetical protein
MGSPLAVCFAMKARERRRCPHCMQSFLPDYRNVYHQRFCSEPTCQHASKRSSQRRWLRKPKNRNYFREPDNIERVRDWRREHPGYWRSRQHQCVGVLRTRLAPASAPAFGINRGSGQPGTLQDVCRSKLPVLTGILSRLSCCTLQEDIANCAREMLSEAQCILVQCQSSSSPPPQASGAVNYHESG